MSMQKISSQQQEPRPKHTWLSVLKYGIIFVLTGVIGTISIWLWISLGLNLFYTVISIIAAIVTITAIIYGFVHFLFRPIEKRLEEKYRVSPTSRNGNISSQLSTTSQQLGVSTTPKPSTTIWNVPYHRNIFFTGRNDILKELHNNLLLGKTTALTQPQAINGLGGVGKTQIALEYTYLHFEEYKYILWVKAETVVTLIDDYSRTASLLKLIKQDEQEQDEQEQDEQERFKIVEIVKQWLMENDGWLLILDNVDNLDIIYDFLPTISKGSIILTTRQHALGGLAQSIEVKEMNLEDATKMLLRRAKVLTPNTQECEEAQKIVRELGNLPLALDQAGAFIEETGCTLVKYFEAYQQRQIELLQNRGIHKKEHPDSIVTTWSLSFEQIERNNAIAAEIMRYCAFLAPDSIPEELILDGATELGSSLQLLITTPTLLDEAIGEILRFSLVRRNSDNSTFSIHRLVQAVIKGMMDEEKRRKYAERVVQAVNVTFPRYSYKIEIRKLSRHLLPHALICKALVEEYKIEVTRFVRLFTRTAYYLRISNRFEEAEQLYLFILNIQEKQFGPNHPDTLYIFSRLAGLYRNKGEYERAFQCYQQILAFREEVLDAKHLEIAGVLNNLGLVLRDLGRDDEAEMYFKRSLAIEETPTRLSHIAHIYKDRCQYEQAEQYYQQALAIKEKKLEPDHPSIATSLNNLGVLYREMKQFDKAKEQFKEALEIRKKHFSENGLVIAGSYASLAQLCREQEKYKEAEELYLKVLSIREQKLGSSHPKVANTLSGLAFLYQAMHNYAKANEFCQRALSIREQTLGTSHPDTVSLRENCETLHQEKE